MTRKDTAFEMTAANLRYGPGATREAGMDLRELGSRRVLVVTDSRVAELPPVQTVCESLAKEGLEYSVFDRVRVEPNEASLREAVAFAADGKYDAFVAVGGGSSIDTAKAANLYTTHPAEFMSYVNAPIGGGQPVPGPLKPMIAVPTTAGTGSETTGVIVFDLPDRRAKTGIAHRRLKPTLAIVDPENTRTLPPMVVASCGLDVLCHAVESFTALPFDERPYPERPLLRPAYQGSNPISDIWALEAIRMATESLPRAHADAEDDEARGQMILASSFAGMGFGNAGVHLCHGMSYPISSMARDYQAPDYPEDHPFVPHGISVALPAGAVFEFTGVACPGRHLEAARMLGADVSGIAARDAGRALGDALVELMRKLGLPNGLSAVGYSSDDIPALVEGTLPQHRVTDLSPRPAGAQELALLFERSMTLW
jgi:hydroxyacid-oxoacid transhydrogenase